MRDVALNYPSYPLLRYTWRRPDGEDNAGGPPRGQGLRKDVTTDFFHAHNSVTTQKSDQIPPAFRHLGARGLLGDPKPLCSTEVLGRGGPRCVLA